MKKGKRFNGKIYFFKSNIGKRMRGELVLYNPLRAKLVSCFSYLAIATSFVVCVSLSKYRGTLASQDIARVAKAVLKLIPKDIPTTMQLMPLNSVSANFEVRNFEGDKLNPTEVNEIMIKYTVNIEHTQNSTPENQLDLQYRLFQIDGIDEREITIINNKSLEIEMSSTSNEIHNYRLDISWPTGIANDAKYANIMNDISISVEAEQID